MISSLVFNSLHKHWVHCFILSPLCLSNLIRKVTRWSYFLPLHEVFDLVNYSLLIEKFEFMGKDRQKNLWSMIIFIFIERITFNSCALYWWLGICKNRESKEFLTYNIQVLPRSISGPELFLLFVNGISRSISAINLLCLFAGALSQSNKCIDVL